MSIQPGVQIGAFTVLGLIGRGGMGEVYRARDGRLKREVALKVLPDEVAAHPERVARFQREAEILATLTHQHIAAIYGLEEADGARALVMELVEGPTLDDRVASGPIPIEEALPLAWQLVGALDYAHGNGVLHRDLKPSNIKVTPDGQVKVLDFGLAKAMNPHAGGGPAVSPDQSPTITSPAYTQAGTILGTAAYMSPEQVRGRAVDRRADIWAFGCVLYEMLTGHRAFAGETVSDTLAAVLKNDPDWTRLPPTVPGSVRQLLEHCLQRDPRARLRDIADARLLLGSRAAAPAPAAVSARAPWMAAAGGALVTAVLFAGAWMVIGPEPGVAGEPVRRVTVKLPVDLPTSTSGGGPAIAIAPDGSAVAFTGRSAGQNQLYVHRFADASTIAVRGPANPNSPAFSPDGTSVAYGVVGGTAAGTIWQVSATGGEADAMCLAPVGFGGVRGVAWTAERGLVFGSPGGLFEAGGSGSCRLVLGLEGEREARFLWPQALPGGRGTLVTVSGVSDDADSAAIVVVPAGSTERRVVVRGARAGRLTASGHLLFARGHQVFAAPFDLDRLTMAGEPAMVLDGVASGQFGGPLLDVSERGDLVYVPGRNTGNRLVWVSRDGTRSDSGAPRRAYTAPPRLSPDGQWVAVSIGTGDHFLWLYSLASGTLTALSKADTHQAVWSPDSRMVGFPLQGLGFGIKDRETTGEPVVVFESGGPSTWSPDGSTLVGNRPSAQGGYELFALDLANRTTRMLLHARQPFVEPQFSPDGQWLSYTSNESGRSEVYVTDYPRAQLRKPVSIDGGSAAVWGRNGRELFYVSGTSMMAVAIRPRSSIEFDRPVRLFDGIDGVGSATLHSVAPDGRFLFVEAGDLDRPDRSQLTLVLNWFTELNRLVPAR